MMRTNEHEIQRLLPMVHSVARKVGRMVPTADRDDLIGDGAVGLIRAVGSYDASRGVPIERYARHVVAGAMLNGLRRMDPISERVRRRLRRAEERRYHLAQERGRMPTYAELEAEDPELRGARTTAHRHVPLSLDAPAIEGEREVRDWEADPASITARRQHARQLLEALELLSERQRKVMVMHYYDDLPLSAISRRMNVSPQRISQLHLAALERLRGAPIIA